MMFDTLNRTAPAAPQLPATLSRGAFAPTAAPQLPATGPDAASVPAMAGDAVRTTGTQAPSSLQLEDAASGLSVSISISVSINGQTFSTSAEPPVETPVKVGGGSERDPVEPDAEKAGSGQDAGIEELFAELDEDGDGKLSLNELLNALRKAVESDREEEEPLLEQEQEEAEREPAGNPQREGVSEF